MKSQKQVSYFPTDQALKEGFGSEDFYTLEGYFFTPEQLNQYTKEVIKQALETAANKAFTKDDPYSYTGNTGSEYPADIIVDKESITNTAQETFKQFEV